MTIKNAMRVLLVEDDPILGESLTEYLESKGCEVSWVQNGEDLYDVKVAEGYDVVVLDLILGIRDGEDILAEMRRNGVRTPVLVLTAKRTLRDKETCFNLGADDYLTKPFEPEELVLRLKALVRRYHPEEKVVLGEVEIDPEGRTIVKDGKEFTLSRTAWELLLLLLRNRGRVVSTETILSCIWGDKPVGTDVVRAYIKELRKVLPPDAIKTYKGIGYKLE